MKLLTFPAVALLVLAAGCASSTSETPPRPSPGPSPTPRRDSTPRTPPSVGVAVTAATPVARPDAPTGDTAVVDDVVRRRQAELRTCYEQEGLKVNPDLAGNVVVSIAVASEGTVSAVTFPERTWSGPGATETESCMQTRVRNWRFPELTGGGGTFEFSFNFSR